MYELFGQLRRFLAVGLINTAVGLGIIWLAMWLGAAPVSANLMGYAIGGVVSYNLNRIWTFAAQNSGVLTAGRFVLVMVICYLLNLGALQAGLSLTDISPYLIQVFCVGVYSSSFFLLSRYYVFRD